MGRTLSEAKQKMSDFLIDIMYSKTGNEFVGLFFSSVNKFPTPVIPVAAVALEESGPTLLYNPERFIDMTDDEKCFVLNHELCHVLSLHFRRSEELMDRHSIPKTEFNTRYRPFSDLPINHSISGLKGYSSVIDTILTYEKVNLSQPELPTYEDIVEYLLDNKDEHDSICDSEGFNNIEKIIYIDGIGNTREEIVGEGDGTMVCAEIDKELVNSIQEDLNNIIDNVSKAAGTIPHNLEKAIKWFKTGILPQDIDIWKRLEHFFIGQRNVNSPKVRSFKRLNRRLGTLPGRIKKLGFNVAFIIDESGSMNDEEVDQAFRLIKRTCLKESNDTIYVIHWDTEPYGEVDEIRYENDLVNLSRKKSGGTVFTDMFTHKLVTACDVDMYIVITDGGIYGWPKVNPNKPCIWIITTTNGYDNWRIQYNKGVAICVEG